MTTQPLNPAETLFFFFKAKIDLDCMAKRHVRSSPLRMKLNCSTCLFFGCECFGLLVYDVHVSVQTINFLCCQINFFKSFIPLPHPPPFGDTRPLWVQIFFFRTPPFPDLATGLLLLLVYLIHYAPWQSKT